MRSVAKHSAGEKEAKFMIQIVLVLLTALNGPIATPQYVTDGAGGPDAYGYRWIDNDTTAPNAPAFRWITLDSINATRVTGLGDDNVVGPFPIGFNFPYYWYRVTSFYVGSNGYIAFDDNQLAASPFTNLPNPARPNNVVAPLLSDLDFSVGTPRCYYRTNVAADTCIISYLGVRWWNMAASICSLQIILAKSDSSITFQYKKVVGTPYQGWGPTANTTGIENILGTVGLSYLNGLLPSQNVLHDTLAVKFYPPQTTSYQVYDVGIWNALNENSGGVFFYNNTPRTLWAKVKNSGNQPVSNCTVYCRVRNASNTIVYTDTKVIASMTPGQMDSITFTPDWTPTSNGVYRSVFRSKIQGDMFTGNDSVIIETRVMTYPGEMMFDDGVLDQGTSWQGNSGGMGVKFIPPRYPCRITAAKAYLYYQNAPLTCTLWVFKGDGPGGTPGTVLGRGNISVTGTGTAPTWCQINLPSNPEITSGAFFVGVTSDGTSDPVYCIDTSPPVSRQTWEYTGVWAPYRSSDVDDCMMRALVDLGSGVEELGPTGVGIPKVSLSAYPNPFTSNTKINLTSKLSPLSVVEIYNSVGEKVTKLTTNENSIIWNGTDRSGRKVSPGIYFAKVKTEDAPVLKILMTN